MHRVFLMAAVAMLLAGCRDGAKEATDRADKAMALVAELQQQVADLQGQVADMDEELADLDPDGPGPGDDPNGPPRYASVSSPESARSMRATVRSIPKIATKEPKRGPWLWPSSTS